MSYTTGTMSAETATYGGLVDAIGGIATVVLAIVFDALWMKAPLMRDP